MNHEQIVSQRLKPKEVPDLRKKLLAAQNGRCPLCGKMILPKDAVLDHDHDTGRCRQVLHRTCNGIEGRVLSWLRRNGQGVKPITMLRNLLDYWMQDYEEQPFHPTHKSDIEEEATKLRKKYKRLKSEKHKALTKAAIQKLLEPDE